MRPSWEKSWSCLHPFTSRLRKHTRIWRHGPPRFSTEIYRGKIHKLQKQSKDNEDGMAEKRFRVRGAKGVSGSWSWSGGIEEAEGIHRGKKTFESKIRFQTPFPARLRVFFEGETCVYNSTEEATKDKARRGFQVTVVKPTESGLGRIKRLTWQASHTETEPGFKQKLQPFKLRFDGHWIYRWGLNILHVLWLCFFTSLRWETLNLLLHIHVVLDY